MENEAEVAWWSPGQKLYYVWEPETYNYAPEGRTPGTGGVLELPADAVEVPLWRLVTNGDWCEAEMVGYERGPDEWEDPSCSLKITHRFRHFNAHLRVSWEREPPQRGEGRVEVPENEFHRTVKLWMRQQRHGDVATVESVQSDQETSGGCPSCYDTYKVVKITYMTTENHIATATFHVEYAQLIKDLERIAYSEERRRPRMRMHADLRRAVKTLVGRPSMVFKIKVKMDAPGPDGTEVTYRAGDTVRWLPPQSVELMLQRGWVTALCTNDSLCGCDWHALAALTREDQEWLELYGWENPFDD